ncbi:hypothetical protein [Streptomyces sp. LN704]|uniref:hypothetical protein n=1 Tax=unclassified Streptomyces TaxID=2593676 RepID=UPI0037116F26
MGRTVAVVLLATTPAIVIALLAAAGAGKLARLDGATYPAAVARAATPPSPPSSPSPLLQQVPLQPS